MNITYPNRSCGTNERERTKGKKVRRIFKEEEEVDVEDDEKIKWMLDVKCARVREN
jgi:hypothetical protein